MSRLAHATDDHMSMLSFQLVPAVASYDAVIITKLNATRYVPAPGQRLIWYVHNVPKHLYTHLDVSMSWLDMLRYVFKRKLYAPNLSYPDRFIANSESAARDMMQYWAIPDEQMTVAYRTGTVQTDITPADAPGQYYDHVGRLAEGKGLSDLVEAATRTQTHVVICGRGPFASALEADAGEHVTFRGYVSEETNVSLIRGPELHSTHRR